MRRRLGSYDVDGGKTTLKSPNYDLSGSTYAVIGYACTPTIMPHRTPTCSL